MEKEIVTLNKQIEEDNEFYKDQIEKMKIAIDESNARIKDLMAVNEKLKTIIKEFEFRKTTSPIENIQKTTTSVHKVNVYKSGRNVGDDEEINDIIKRYGGDTSDVVTSKVVSRTQRRRKYRSTSEENNGDLGEE